jgi:8-oxo-dGTP diphosphatase
MANFCPECGTHTITRMDGGRDRDVCPNCGWVQYAATAVGVGALICRGDRVLLVERGIPPVGRWTLPSGWIEQEDTLATAVVREVREETGLECVPQGIICVRNIPKPARNELYICFLCEVDDAAEPVPDGDESTQAIFVHPDEFDALDLSPFSRYIIESYKRAQPGIWTPDPEAADFAAYPPMAVFSPF